MRADYIQGRVKVNFCHVKSRNSSKMIEQKCKQRNTLTLGTWKRKPEQTEIQAFMFGSHISEEIFGRTSLKLTFRALITRIKALTHYSQLAHNAQLSSEYSM